MKRGKNRTEGLLDTKWSADEHQQNGEEERQEKKEEVEGGRKNKSAFLLQHYKPFDCSNYT